MLLSDKTVTEPSRRNTRAMGTYLEEDPRLRPDAVSLSGVQSASQANGVWDTTKEFLIGLPEAVPMKIDQVPIGFGNLSRYVCSLYA